MSDFLSSHFNDSSKMRSLVVLLSNAILLAVANGQDCNARGMKKLDDNFARLLTIGNSGRRFPENHGELPKYCDDSRKYLEAIDKHRNTCLKDSTKNMVGVLVYAMRNTMRQLCKKGSKKIVTLMEAAPCNNQGNIEISKCYATMIDNLQGIQNHPDDKKKLPMLCCNYHRTFDCIGKRLLNVRACDQKTIDSTIDFVKGVGGNFVDIFCGDYTDGSDSCNKLGPFPKKRKSQIRTRSFMLPTIEMFNSFKD